MADGALVALTSIVRWSSETVQLTVGGERIHQRSLALPRRAVWTMGFVPTAARLRLPSVPRITAPSAHRGTGRWTPRCSKTSMFGESRWSASARTSSIFSTSRVMETPTTRLQTATLARSLASVPLHDRYNSVCITSFRETLALDGSVLAHRRPSMRPPLKSGAYAGKDPS